MRLRNLLNNTAYISHGVSQLKLPQYFGGSKNSNLPEPSPWLISSNDTLSLAASEHHQSKQQNKQDQRHGQPFLNIKQGGLPNIVRNRLSPLILGLIPSLGQLIIKAERNFSVASLDMPFLAILHKLFAIQKVFGVIYIQDDFSLSLQRIYFNIIVIICFFHSCSLMCYSESYLLSWLQSVTVNHCSCQFKLNERKVIALVKNTEKQHSVILLVIRYDVFVL